VSNRLQHIHQTRTIQLSLTLSINGHTQLTALLQDGHSPRSTGGQRLLISRRQRLTTHPGADVIHQRQISDTTGLTQDLSITAIRVRLPDLSHDLAQLSTPRSITPLPMPPTHSPPR
jgi:hypothetical protein